MGSGQAEKVKARSALNHAKQSGKVEAVPCAICGSVQDLEAHHYAGYEPEHHLDVVWLCLDHHWDVEYPSRPNHEAAKGLLEIYVGARDIFRRHLGLVRDARGRAVPTFTDAVAVREEAGL